MAGLRLEHKIDTRAPEAMLRRLADFDRRALAEDVGDLLVSSTTQRFRDGVDPEGNPWEPSERALAEGGKTLVDRGHLRDSITYFVHLDGTAVEIGSNMVYAAIHQFGGKAGRRGSVTLPPRPYLGISADDEADIDDALQEHLQRALQ
jgi:phage virion morphogenesis protein